MICGPRRRYWFEGSTGSLTNATPTPVTFDATALRRRHPEVNYWRLESIVGFRDATATMGNLLMTGWLFDGFDLDADLAWQSGFQLVDLGILFPFDWSGKFGFTAENRTGATSTFLMSFGFEPILDLGRVP